MKVLLIIPAYNEEESILSVVQTVEKAGYDYVVVNDGSSDNTLQVLRDNRLNHINLSHNLGIGGSVQTGHLYALSHGYDVDIQVDGDGQHDISYVPRLLERIEAGADLVIGSRFVEQTNGFQSTGLRRAGIRWLQRCIRHVTGLNITDSTSGFRACDRKAFQIFCKRYPFDYPEPESIVMAYRTGLRVEEVPVKMRERQGGVSSINPAKSVYYMIKVSLAILIEGHRGGRER